MIRQIITGLKSKKESVKHRFPEIGNENLEDILQDLCLDMILADKTFPTLQSALNYWRKAFVNKCRDYLYRQGQREKELLWVSAKHWSRWRNPRYKKYRLTFAWFTISDLIARLMQGGMMTLEIHYCILCDALGLSRAEVCRMNAISRDQLSRLIKEGRRQLEYTLLEFYLIDDRLTKKHRL